MKHTLHAIINICMLVIVPAWMWLQFRCACGSETHMLHMNLHQSYPSLCVCALFMAASAMQVFDAYDIDHSGSISMSELGEMLCNPDDPRCVPDTVAAALREADTNHDDAISFEEFAALLRTSKVCGDQ